MAVENTDYREEKLDLENKYDMNLVKTFLDPLGFDYDVSSVEYTMLLSNLNGDIIGTGSFQGEILKYVVVSPKFRETPAFAQIVTHLTDILIKKTGHIFVYTHPKSAKYFEGLGFAKLVTAEPLYAVLEFGYTSIGDYQKYLLTRKVKAKTENIAAVVVNCNPFTNGHKYLIEKAAAENEIVYLFVVEEDRSAFPFKIRWELIEKGICHLKNVVMVRGDRYVVSGGTFPAYFLKNESQDAISQKQTEIDVKIFAKYLAPVLNIKKRYVGTEVYCNTTAFYNTAMKNILPKSGIKLIEIERKTICSKTNYISASKVRQAVKEDSLDSILGFLPESTKEFLLSERSEEIINKIKKADSRH
ncbi:[citrate (pro-3S)-lyase] ligase [Candidatus Margulisiibacteriota bacterium]